METPVEKKIVFENLVLPVEGMTCASCVARVEKAIKKVEGVESVSVNLANEKASIKINKDVADVKKIVEMVEDAGYTIKYEPEVKELNDATDTPVIDEHYLKLKKDLITSTVLTIPVFILNMGMMYSHFPHYIGLSHDYINKILLVLTTIIVFGPGKRFFTIFYKNLLHFTADMNSLVAVGTGSAFIYSALLTLFPEVFAAVNNAHTYYDTAAMIITLILMGRFLESRAKSKTNTAVKKLLSLKPKNVLVKRNGSEIEIKLNELKLNDIVIIKPGGKLPADGIIISGESFLDESMLTGESLPVRKFNNSEVFAGTINSTGAFEYRVTAIDNETLLGKIIRMVEEAQSSKAPIQNLADKISAIFVPVVVIIALVTFIVWIITGAPFNLSLMHFIAVLLIACPCALGLATPTAIIAASGKGAESGILIKNGESLELAHKIKTVILDKTGTITEGKPKLTKVVTHLNEEIFLKAISSLESKSEHPLAKAFIEYSTSKGIVTEDIQSFESITGKGIKGNIANDQIIAGSLSFMEENKIFLDGYSKDHESFSNDGKTVIFAAINSSAAGFAVVEDPIKDSSIQAVKELKALGIKVIMLTGDNKKTAAAIAKLAGIDGFKAEVLPNDKAGVVAEYQKGGNIVAMVGDGINDSPALAKSDVGIAIGQGTDVAIETASVVLIKNDLMDVVKTIKISKKTIRIIKQNLFWAFIYNVLGIPLAAFGILEPIFAALAMSFSSVSVITNSLRLRKG